jgi:hypothetical protein
MRHSHRKTLLCGSVSTTAVAAGQLDQQRRAYLAGLEMGKTLRDAHDRTNEAAVAGRQD